MPSKLVELPTPSKADLYSETIDQIIDLVAVVREAIYPVGSIFMSTKPTNPSQFIGGTWEAIEDRYLVGVGSAHAIGTTGGQLTHHHRTAIGWDGVTGLFAYNKDGDQIPKFGSEVIERGDSYAWKADLESQKNWLRIAYTEEESSEPPFFPVYIWERTA